MNIFEKLNLCVNTRVFSSISENGALILYFKQNHFENLKKLQSIVNIFVFFVKISCQSKESPLSKQSPFSPIPSFLEKIFHPHPYCKIRESQSQSPSL